MSFLRRLFSKKPAEREEDRFANMVVEALYARGTDIRVEYHPDTFELLHIDERSVGERMFLHNSFREYQRLPSDERDRHLVRVVDFIMDSRAPKPSGEAALNRLLPVLRARADIIAVTAETGHFPYERSSRPFCDVMLLMLAVDTETSIGLVTDDFLDELKVSFDDALGLAVAHLNELGNHGFDQLQEGAFLSSCGDYYDASRVLIPELIEQLPLKGNAVAIVLSRSAVLVTGGDDLDGLEKIAQIALDDFPENERAISLTPIELRNGGWQPLAITEQHPLALRNLAPNQTAWTYGATAPTLQAILGDDIFVASALLIEGEGKYATAANWGAGVRTACPLIDAVWIEADESFPEITRSLEDVLSVCGPFKDIEEMPYPKRWHLPGRMSDEQRKVLTEQYPDHVLFGESS